MLRFSSLEYAEIDVAPPRTHLAGDKARLVYIVPGGDSGWRMAYETMPPDYPLGPWNMDKLWDTPSYDGGDFDSS